MARTVVITDDIDGSPNAETIQFTFDGGTYEIDLARKNRTALEKALRPYLEVARRAAARPVGTVRRRSRGRAHLTEIRTWAATQGLSVSTRGRIPQNVMDAYNAAH